MRATSVTYSKAVDLGASHETIKVTVEILPGETAQQAITLAKKFVNHNVEHGPDPELARAREIVENPDDHTGNDWKWAKSYIAALPPVTSEPIL